MNESFKPGDKVRCVDNSDLPTFLDPERVYTVSDCKPGAWYNYLYLAEFPSRFFYSYRFKKVDD